MGWLWGNTSSSSSSSSSGGSVDAPVALGNGHIDGVEGNGNGVGVGSVGVGGNDGSQTKANKFFELKTDLPVHSATADYAAHLSPNHHHHVPGVGVDGGPSDHHNHNDNNNNNNNDNNNDNDHGNDNHEGNEDDDRILLAMTWRSMTVAAGRRLTD